MLEPPGEEEEEEPMPNLTAEGIVFVAIIHHNDSVLTGCLLHLWGKKRLSHTLMK